METLLDVVRVEARKDHTLLLEFENGERRVFDMSPYLMRKPYLALNSIPLFLSVRIEQGTLAWPGDLDIAPDTLYFRSVPEA